MYRVLVTRTLDVPTNLYHAILESEEEAKKVAQEKLTELDGDVAVVSMLKHGVTRVLHTFEKIGKAGEVR